jgi:glucan-binding YG repeat protein
LPHGRYTLEIYGETAAPYVRGDSVDTARVSCLLATPAFWVGEKGKEPQQERQTQQPVLDGWVCKDGKWYCYQAGTPLTGWQKHMGVSYYLQADGSVTTGWATVDGLERYFTDTGAMNIGWLRTHKGLRYSLSDGCFVTGWQTIGASRYYFTNRGYAQVSGSRKDGDILYRFQSDGMAVPVNINR